MGAEAGVELHAGQQSLSSCHGGSRAGHDFSEMHLLVIGRDCPRVAQNLGQASPFSPGPMHEEGPSCKPAAGISLGFGRMSSSVLWESPGSAPLHPSRKPGQEKLKGQRSGKRSFQGCDVLAGSSERLPCALGCRLSLWGFMGRSINSG